MIFTLSATARSLADYLAPVLPGVTFYEDPNQQDSQMPCMFLQQRYAYISPRPGERRLRPPWAGRERPLPLRPSGPVCGATTFP